MADGGAPLRRRYFDRLAGDWDRMLRDGARRRGELDARIGFLRGVCGEHRPRVLELGCATGTNLIALAPCITRGVGVDFSPQMIERAIRNAEAAGAGNLAFAVGDARTLDAVPAAAGPFDLIILAGTLEHIPEHGAVLAGCRTRLRTGGRLVVIMPHPQNPVFLWQRLRHGQAPRIFPTDRHRTPRAVSRMAADHGFQSVAVHPLPCRPAHGGRPQPPAWVGRVMDALERIPLPAMRGAYGLILEAVA